MPEGAPKMMDELLIRQGQGTVLARLKELDTERDVLLELVKNYQSWLRIAGGNGHSPMQPAQQIPLMPATTRKKTVRRTGARPRVRKANSWRALIQEKLKKENGLAIHSRDIWGYLQSRGLTTVAKNPLAAVDVTARSIPGVRKAGPRLWAWGGIHEATPPSTNHTQEPSAVGK